MFLDWVSSLTLLEHSPDTHILKEFSLPVQKVLVQQVVTFLLDGTNSKRALTNPAHVIWAMEVCGQGFCLPIEEEESISKVINLYRIWALEPNQRPSSISENLQFFLQKILCHYSLLFAPRTNAKDLLEKHAALCSTVLSIFANIGRHVGTSMSTETWEVFLKLMIGIVDSILYPDAPATQEPVQRKLCPQLLNVLFELWLLSRTRNPKLWEALKLRVRGWTHHISLVNTWKMTSFALTRRSVALLYGVSEGAETVAISVDDSVQNMNLEDDYVFYAWHRVLNLIGNPNEAIQHPPIFVAFMNGVEILVHQYLKIGTTKALENARYLPPSGNTILHIFGSWLFDCIHLDRNGFDEGTALATKILCTIMFSKHTTQFLTVYTSSFFSSLQRALLQDGRVLVSAITTCYQIFNFDFQGLRCLVPSFFGAIQRVLTTNVRCDNVISPEAFRKSCLTILGTMLSLANHFGETEFVLPPNPPESSALPKSLLEVKCYSDLKPHISALLLEALAKETHQSNIEHLLNLCYIWSCEELSSSADFTRSIIGLIVRKVTQWKPPEVACSLRLLEMLSIHYSKISKAFTQANLIVDQLCRYITATGNPCAPHLEPLVILAFQCISSWIVADQWLLQFKDTRVALLSAIVIGLTGRPSEKPTEAAEPPLKESGTGTKEGLLKKKRDKKAKDKSPAELAAVATVELSDKIRDAAYNTLHAVLNHLGNFPTASGPSVVSSLATEDEILQEIITRSDGQITIEDSKEYLRYYITDDRIIICVIDRRYATGGPCSSVIVRDKSGRYAWDAMLNFLPTTLEEPEIPNHDHPAGISITPYQPSLVKSMDVNSLSDVLGYLNQCKSKSALKIIEKQVRREYKTLKKSNFRLNVDCQVPITKPSNPYIGDCKIQYTRMLLSHLGYLSLESRCKLFPINMTQAFYQSLRQLDTKQERLGITVGVLFARKGQNEDEWLFNEGGTMDYQEFISTLGWGVNVASHHGFTGTLDGYCGSVAPYYSTHSLELIYNVSTLIPNHPGEAPRKRNHVFNNSCVVVWYEDALAFQSNSIWKHAKQSCSLIITIAPLSFGLYLVRLYHRDGSPCGPLVDGAIVSKDILGQLVRDTAIQNFLVGRGENALSPTQIREDAIEKIYANFKNTCTLEQFYTSQFTSLNTDQIGPFQGGITPMKLSIEVLPDPSPVESKREKRGPDRTRSKRLDKVKKEKSEKSDKSDRSEKSERSDRSERSERSDRSDKSDKSDKSERLSSSSEGKVTFEAKPDPKPDSKLVETKSDSKIEKGDAPSSPQVGGWLGSSRTGNPKLTASSGSLVGTQRGSVAPARSGFDDEY